MCVGIPCQILSIDSAGVMPMGSVSMAGIEKKVCMAYVPEAKVGDYVLIQQGFAITCMDQCEAEESLRTWQELGVLDCEGKPADSACVVFPKI